MKPRERTTERPRVIVNMAMTADGKIATANRKISSFGSARDKARMLELRARADAILAGARTVDSGEVTMGPGGARYQRMRLRRGLPAYPVRVIASRSASIDPKAAIFSARFSPVIILTTKAAPERRKRQLARLAEIHECGSREINWPSALRWLAQAHGVRTLLCEGGGELNDALFRAGVVDELHLTVCPWIFGGREAPTIADGQGVDALALAARFKLKRAVRVGREMFLSYEAERAGVSASRASNQSKSARRLR
jgi:riboflavin-specific deaminase-like protein